MSSPRIQTALSKPDWPLQRGELSGLGSWRQGNRRQITVTASQLSAKDLPYSKWKMANSSTASMQNPQPKQIAKTGTSHRGVPGIRRRT